MTGENELDVKKVSKGMIILITLLYWILEFSVQIGSLIPQMIPLMVGALKADPTVDSHVVMEEIFSQLRFPWYQNVLQILVIMLILYLFKRQKVNFFEKPNLNYKKWFQIIIFGFVSFGLSFALEWVITYLQPNFDTDNQVALELIFANTSLITMFISVVLIAPFMEEVMMRGVFMGVLFKEHKLIGLLLSTTIFAMLHGPSDILSFLVYAVPGLTLGLIYWKTDWLGASIFAHFLNNFISFLMILNG